MTTTIEPGIHFGMSDDEYHALPLLSASHIKNILVSPMDFWARSWMNPWKEEEVESEAKMIGKAYHKRILEGAAAFGESYAPIFKTTDPNVIHSTEDVKEALRDLGQPVSFARKADGVARLLLADPAAKIYDVMKEEYETEHHGKGFLTEDLIRKIELSAAMIENHHALKYYFVGGYAEVTVIWDDEEFGVRMKARFDYLKVNAINDLKTFANQMNKPIERAIYGEIASRKYFVQASHYIRASTIAKKLAAEGKVFGAAVDPEWLQAFIDSPDHLFNFVFQQKGVAPVAVGAVFKKEDNMFGVGIAAISDGVDRFKRCLDTFGTDPWVDMRDPIILTADSYPAYATEL